MGCRVGVGRAVITPTNGGASAGWSIAGLRRVAEKPLHTPDLVATALALYDGQSEPVVLIFADLHCGGAALWRELSRRTGVPPERLIIAGTHTHAGPGHIYGSAMYNASTTPLAVPLPIYAGTLAKQIAPAVLQALTGMVPGGVDLISVNATDVASNRAIPAVLRVESSEREGFLTEGPGAGLTGALADRLRDPRVRVWVVAEQGCAPFAALATAAVHGTCLGPKYPFWGADWAGEARIVAEAQLGRTLVGFAGGASGDISPLALDELGERRSSGTVGRDAEQGEGLAKTVGARIAAAVVEAVGRANPGPFTVSCGHELWRPARDARLGAPRAGLATAGGGIDGITGDAAWAALSAGVAAPAYSVEQAWPSGHSQHPKVPIERAWGFGSLPISAGVGSLIGPKRLPLHAVRIGSKLVVTVPGEPSTFAAWRIERALLEAGAEAAMVLGFAGDYAGYWVTPEAYDQQRYEGASTLFGRLSSEVLGERLLGLAQRCLVGGTAQKNGHGDAV